MAQSMNDAVCAGCGKPLGVRANWRLVRGRGYHNDCEPAPEPKEPPDNTTDLKKFFERKARDAMHGRGQRTLEEDADE